MDKDTSLAILNILEISQEVMKGTSDTRILTLQIHGALVKARVRATWRHMNLATTTRSLD